MMNILKRTAGILGLLVLLSSSAAVAQTRFHFMQMTVAGRIPFRIYFAPAFKGQAGVELERGFLTLSQDKFADRLQRNDSFVMQKLGELSADGWELVTTTSQTGGKDETDYVRYLFRKAY
ncbi:hypothetical protein MUN82_20505 [Hymenobacter aerilatus]|uniref:DUF4177 domain-containing protein n=1 Tax=Hymenobacter aerilatus TaxID=2932251 RepID=A0A8T9SV95_9BACT|nr:hypothetical protein [Hymenobacter aerilatus]UOR05301.1 hypothetical protein MUN82_20505 [Hymenobacter aerilatus]